MFADQDAVLSGPLISADSVAAWLGILPAGFSSNADCHAPSDAFYLRWRPITPTNDTDHGSAQHRDTPLNWLANVNFLRRPKPLPAAGCCRLFAGSVNDATPSAAHWTLPQQPRQHHLWHETTPLKNAASLPAHPAPQESQNQLGG